MLKPLGSHPPWCAPVGGGAWKPTFPQAGAGLWGLAGHCSLRGQVSPNSRSRLPAGPQTPAAGGEALHHIVTTIGLGPSVSQGFPAEGSHVLLPLLLARAPVPLVEPPFCGPDPVLPASVPAPLVTRPHQPHLGPGVCHLSPSSSVIEGPAGYSSRIQTDSSLGLPGTAVHQALDALGSLGDWFSAVPSGLNPGSAPWSSVTLGAHWASLGLVSFPCEMQSCTCWNHMGGTKAQGTEQALYAGRLPRDVGTVPSEECGCEM